MPATRSPEICFCTLFPETLTFWPNIKWVATSQDCCKFGNCIVSAVLVLSCRQTHRQTQMNALLRRLSSAWVITVCLIVHRITAVDTNDLYDFMVIDAQQKNAGKSFIFWNYYIPYVARCISVCIVGFLAINWSPLQSLGMLNSHANDKL